MNTIHTALELLGWGTPHLVALLVAMAVSTIVGWIVKYPLRLWFNARGRSVESFRYTVRMLTGIGAAIGALVAWPDHSWRDMVAGAAIAWLVVFLIYKYSGPLLKRYAPWISTDSLKTKPDPTDEAGA